MSEQSQVSQITLNGNCIPYYRTVPEVLKTHRDFTAAWVVVIPSIVRGWHAKSTDYTVKAIDTAHAPAFSKECVPNWLPDDCFQTRDVALVSLTI